MKDALIVETLVEVPLSTAWQIWTEPEHITQWNRASRDWHSPRASNDLRPGGRFNYRMEAREGNFGFDFCGCYDVVEHEKRIAYTIDDQRKVEIEFIAEPGGVRIREQFEAESLHSTEQQQSGWQAILDNFKRYAESKR